MSVPCESVRICASLHLLESEHCEHICMSLSDSGLTFTNVYEFMYHSMSDQMATDLISRTHKINKCFTLAQKMDEVYKNWTYK